MKQEHKAKKATAKTTEAINHPGVDPIGDPGTANEYRSDNQPGAGSADNSG